MTPRALAPLLALLVLALPAAASPTPAAASSDACLPAAGDAWGPAVAGACSASFQGGLAVACGETCRVVLSGRATASSAAPTGARV
ncbi:MAG TPA: hypothetical protein VHH36_04995, partial [Candidatus Thermoplasmatota archaeon]|nr:hypothetical protein [Candidatus Thermoplasmatota archaeon]